MPPEVYCADKQKTAAVGSGQAKVPPDKSVSSGKAKSAENTNDWESVLEKRIAKTEKDYGFKIHWRTNGMVMPQELQLNASIKQISKDNVLKLMDLIDELPTKHPADTLRKTLNNVYLFDRISIYGNTGCMAYGYDIFMGGDLPVYVLRTMLFHEFGHVVNNRFGVDKKEWESALPEGVKYIGNEKAIQGNPFSEDPVHRKNGFLMQYSQGSTDEEFAILSEHIFVQPEKMKELAQEWPEVRKRLKLALDHYRKVSAKYDFKDFDEVINQTGRAKQKK